MREAHAGHGVAEEAVSVGEVAVPLGQAEDGSDGGVDGEVAPVVGCDEEGEVFHFLDEVGDVAEVTRQWGGAAEEGHLGDLGIGERERMRRLRKESKVRHLRDWNFGIGMWVSGCVRCVAINI